MSLYLYCLRESSRCERDKSETTPEDGTCHASLVVRGGLSVIKSPGVNGNDGVIIRAFDGIEAVVSEVNAENFGEMQKKAQEDIQWIREKALAHEMVVEEVMGENLMDRNDKATAGPEALALPTIDSGKGRATASLPCRLNPSPVIPVKFGVIFNNEERLAKVINEQRAAIIAAFDRIRAKHEWSVKLYLKDNQKFRDQVRQKSDKLSEKSAMLAALPAGRAYFMEEEFNGELERECSRRLDEEAMETFEELKPFAAEATLVKILDSKLTGRSERMILNSACLIADNHLQEFENAVAKMRKKLAQRGFLLEQGGPWPAYHFTEFST